MEELKGSIVLKQAFPPPSRSSNLSHELVVIKTAFVAVWDEKQIMYGS